MGGAVCSRWLQLRPFSPKTGPYQQTISTEGSLNMDK